MREQTMNVSIGEFVSGIGSDYRRRVAAVIAAEMVLPIWETWATGRDDVDAAAPRECIEAARVALAHRRAGDAAYEAAFRDVIASRGLCLEAARAANAAGRWAEAYEAAEVARAANAAAVAAAHAATAVVTHYEVRAEDYTISAAAAAAYARATAIAWCTDATHAWHAWCTDATHAAFLLAWRRRVAARWLGIGYA
jgi:hypothetical protein